MEITLSVIFIAMLFRLLGCIYTGAPVAIIGEALLYVIGSAALCIAYHVVKSLIELVKESKK